MPRKAIQLPTSQRILRASDIRFLIIYSIGEGGLAPGCWPKYGQRITRRNGIENRPPSSGLGIEYLLEIKNGLNHRFFADGSVYHQVVQPTRGPLHLEISLNELHAFVVHCVHALLRF